MTCFSLCDFDETNPCTADEVCSQSDSGVECKNQGASFESKTLKANNFDADVFNAENFDDETYFTSFQMGVSIALSVMGTLIAIGIIYGVIQYRR